MEGKARLLRQKGMGKQANINILWERPARDRQENHELNIENFKVYCDINGRRFVFFIEGLTKK